MTDWLSVMERGLKAMRYGIFQASDKLAETLDGLCRAPEDSASASPAAAVVAPSPKQGSDSGPADSDIPPSPAGPHPTFAHAESTATLLSSAASWISNDLDEHERNGPSWTLSRMLVDDLRVRAIELRNTKK